VPEISGVSHIDLTVTDLDRSLAFYTDVLGFNEVVREDGDDHAMVVMSHQGLVNMVCLNRHGSGGQPRFDEMRIGLDHLSFLVPSRAALEEWERHLDERGVTYTPIAEAPYGSVLVSRDPDNIQLELLSNPGT
jgi:glyoxylase I family protein